MKTSLQRIVLATGAGAAVLAALIAGCSTPQKNVEKSEYSGFLKDYSRLQPAKSPSGSPVMRWVSPDLNKGNYTKVYLDPPVLFLGKNQKPSKQVTQETMDQIVSYFGHAQREVLQRNNALASGPGPNTLRVRTAITAVRTQKEALKPYDYIPVALLFKGAETALGERDTDSAVYVEGEVTDSQTGELLAEFARQDAGPDLKNESTQLTLQDVQPLLDKWVTEFYAQMKNLTAPQAAPH